VKKLKKKPENIKPEEEKPRSRQYPSVLGREKN
jgi:hypothetical protein